MNAPAPPKVKRRRGFVGPPRAPRAPAKPRYRRRDDPEHKLQMATKEFLDLALKRISGLWWTGIDHANAKSAYTGAQRKRRGIKPGIPDLLFLWRGRNIWIELKAELGSLSDEQLVARAEILSAGGYWHEARSIIQVEAILLGHGIPLNAHA